MKRKLSKIVASCLVVGLGLSFVTPVSAAYDVDTSTYVEIGAFVWNGAGGPALNSDGGPSSQPPICSGIPNTPCPC